MRVIRYISLLLILALILPLSACKALGEASSLTEYDIAGEKVPAITGVVGDRKVSYVETGTSNGVPYKQYTYDSSTVVDDLAKYIQYMDEHVWYTTQDYNLSVVPGTAQLAKNSSDAGMIIIISIAYESNKYIINIQKTEGTLTVY